MASSSQIEPALIDAGCTLTPDRFGGVAIAFEFGAPPAAGIPWEDAWTAVLAAWKREDKYRGVWLTLNPKDNPAAGVILQGAVEAGFELHCVDGSSVTLKHWLPDTATALPDAPHHQVGIAGMVINARDEVLVIQERRGPTASLKGFWKLPGGLVDPGEDMSAAVVREIEEETGVRAKFHSLVAFRESHLGPFGSTDIYCVCACTLQDGSLYDAQREMDQPVSPHPDEIKQVAWLPLKEFLGSKYYAKGLYGALLKTAAGPARAAAREAMDLSGEGVGVGGEESHGLQEIKMESRPGLEESLFFAGKRAKL